MTEPPLPAKSGASSSTSGALLMVLGLIVLIAVIISVLVVMFEGPNTIAILVMGLSSAVAFLCLRAAQQRLPGTRVGCIAVVTAVVLFGLMSFAIVGPGLFPATQRSKQKQTMADMRSIATVIEAYATDHGESYPKANSFDELPQFLVPTYIRSLPNLDGWKHPFLYQHVTNADATESYFVGSAGEDGKWEKRALSDYTTTQATPKWDNDIILGHGEFVQYPEGIQAP